jgi:hypothetical protein
MLVTGFIPQIENGFKYDFGLLQSPVAFCPLGREAYIKRLP